MHPPAAGADRPVRPQAREHHPGSRTGVRDVDGPPGHRDRAPRPQRDGAPHQDRGQPRAPLQPRRHRCLRAGVDPLSLRPRPVAGEHAPRPDRPVGSGRRRSGTCRVGGAGHGRGRDSHPDGDCHFPVARRGDPGVPEGFPRRAVGPLGGRGASQHGGGGAPRLRGAPRGAARSDSRRRHRHGGVGCPRGGPRLSAIRARLRASPRGRAAVLAGSAPPWRHVTAPPTLQHREHAHLHGHRRGSSIDGPPQRGRRLRLRPRGGAPGVSRRLRGRAARRRKVGRLHRQRSPRAPRSQPRRGRGARAARDPRARGRPQRRSRQHRKHGVVQRPSRGGPRLT